MVKKLADANNFTDTLHAVRSSTDDILNTLEDIVNRSSTGAVVPGRLNVSNTGDEVDGTAVHNWLISGQLGKPVIGSQIKNYSFKS